MRTGKQKKQILITGGSGRLGKHLTREFSENLLLTPSHKEFDLSRGDLVGEVIKKHKPGAVIHAAAMTSVDKCERDKEAAWLNNVAATENLVESVLRFTPETYFIYISTACVFRGDRGMYSEDDPPYPKNFYGLTKAVSEYVVRRLKNHLILRTNFAERGPWPHPAAFTDRFGTYLYADDAAAAIKKLVGEKRTGLVHVCGSKKMSMYEFAKLGSPEVGRITVGEDKNYLTKDMTLVSKKIPAFELGFASRENEP